MQVSMRLAHKTQVLAFMHDLNYFLTTALSLGFSNSLRYDTQLSDRASLTTENTGPKSKTLLVDYHFYADYHFKAFVNSELVLRLGRSYLKTDSQITPAIEQNSGHADRV